MKDISHPTLAFWAFKGVYLPPKIQADRRHTLPPVRLYQAHEKTLPFTLLNRRTKAEEIVWGIAGK
jgi:hypothetical protein